MKKYIEYDVRMPEYALSYIHNNDSSGCSDIDIKLIDSYMKGFYSQAKEVKGHVVVGIPEDEQDCYFEPFPAFGYACNVYDLTITILI